MATPSRGSGWASGERSRTGRDTCPRCGQDRVTVLGMDLGDGTGAELRACGACETREWLRDGQPVTREEVLSSLRHTGGPGRRSGGRPPGRGPA